jgi:hypothetical protein
MSARGSGRAVVVTAATFLAACAARPVLPPDYPCTLRPLAALGPDFVVRQHIEASGHGKSGGFDAVLQKKGGTLVLIGLVAGVRAFVLKQDGDRVTFDQSMGPPMPFPASYAIIDIHRAYWKRLPHPGDAAPTGVVKGDLDGESVEEVWSNGSLVTRRFSRPGQMRGAVTIEYGAGCTAERCLPASVRIVNEWLGYAIRVDNSDFTML